MGSLYLVASVAKCSIHTAESCMPGHVVTPSSRPHSFRSSRHAVSVASDRMPKATMEMVSEKTNLHAYVRRGARAASAH
jgi:hypothetical protein